MTNQNTLFSKTLDYLEPFQNDQITEVIRYPVIGRFVLTHAPMRTEATRWTLNDEATYLVRDLPATAQYLSTQAHPAVISVNQVLHGYRKGLENRKTYAHEGPPHWTSEEFEHLDMIAAALLGARIQVFCIGERYPLEKYSISYKFKGDSLLAPLFRNHTERNLQEDREKNYGISRLLNKYDQQSAIQRRG